MKVVIVGPTGVGKTKLSVEIAKWMNAVVVNADASQIYQELDIGTAKVTEEEKDGVKHLLFDIKNPLEEYDVSKYQKDVREIFDNYNNIVLVGGTGLYINAALYDYRFLSDELDINLDKFSNDELYKMAKEKDSNCNIDKNNRVRLERFIKRNNSNVDAKLLYDDCIFIGLTTDRNKLYNIIDRRVDEMFDKGLVREVEELYKKYPESKILKRAIGYKEVIEYLKGNISLDDAKRLIKLNSRHYAKRQYTWFNNKLNVKWFLVDYDNFTKTVEDVKKYILDYK